MNQPSNQIWEETQWSFMKKDRVLISLRGPFFSNEIPMKFHEKVAFHLISFTCTVEQWEHISFHFMSLGREMSINEY